MIKATCCFGVIGFCILAAVTAYGEPALTIYNQNFAVVRDSLALDLAKGVNEVRFSEITAHVEPDSVILRDPAGKQAIQILEQNYRADPVSEPLLLSLYEGSNLAFRAVIGDQETVVTGKVIRSGYVPHQAGLRRYGQEYYQSQMARAYGPVSQQPIIEVDGKLRFSLPGQPMFPALADDTILKPTLHWILETDAAGKLAAEISYVTGGMDWEAAYNIVAPEKGDVVDAVGWVTIDNQSGKDFGNARIKLIAGDVSKIQPPAEYGRRAGMDAAAYASRGGMAPVVTEKAFDEYHLYELQRPTTLHDRETKQVEFVRAAKIKSERFYIYDGAKIDVQRYGSYGRGGMIQDREYGILSNPKVWVMREFANTEANGLGIPLPKGRVRFYRRDADGQLEFTGENVIDHTPKEEMIRVYTGNAFDLAGERRQTQFNVDSSGKWMNESFEIKVRNHKKEPVEIRIAEHLYRWVNWEITAKSNTYLKLDAQTIEFRVQLQPDEEKTITYTVRYTW